MRPRRHRPAKILSGEAARYDMLTNNLGGTLNARQIDHALSGHAAAEKRWDELSIILTPAA